MPRKFATAPKHPKDDDLKQIYVVFPEYIYNTVTEITRLSIKLKSTNPYIANPVNFVVSLFSEFGNTIISKESFQNLWYNSLLIAREGNKEWILDYWVYALQIAEYTMDNRAWRQNIPEDVRKKYEIELQYFIDQHYALGAYLFYKKRMEVVDEIQNLKISSSSRRLLIPDSLQKIIGFLKRIESTPYQKLTLQLAFPFFETKGTQDAEFIEGCIIRYFLYCLLYRTDKSIGRTTDPVLSLSSSDSKDREIVDRLRQILYDDILYFESLGFHRSWLSVQVDNKLKEIRDDIDDNIKREISSQTITHRNLDLLESKSKKLFEETLESYLKPNADISGWDSHKYSFESNVKITKETIYLFGDKTFEPLPARINGAFARFVGARYVGLLYSPYKTFNVDYSEIGKALDKLQLPKDGYSVVGAGGVDSLADTRIQQPLLSLDAAIYIFKSDNLIKAVVDFQSDVKHDAIGDEGFILKFSCEFMLKVSPNLRFIKLRIVHSLIDGRESALSEIRPIEELLP